MHCIDILCPTLSNGKGKYFALAAGICHNAAMPYVKKILTFPVRLVDSLLDRVIAIAGALAVSQVPGFISHYLQRLGGHVAEAERNVTTGETYWQKIADKTTGGDLDVLIDTYLGSDLATTVEAGRKCAADVARLKELRAALEAITNSSLFNKPFAFLRHMEAEIARATAREYTPNLPLDPESLVYAAAGLLLAMLLYQGVKFALVAAAKRIFRRRKKEPEEPPGAGDQ